MKKVKLPILAVAAVGLLLGGYLYWRHSVRHPTTDDAYVQAHVVQVAPEVSGPVAQVHARDQQHVRKGEALVDLDTRRFAFALAQANAHLARVEQEVGADRAALKAAEADVVNQQIALRNAEREAKRVAGLRREGFVSAQAYDNAIAAAREARAKLDAAAARRDQAHAEVGDTAGHNERIREANAAAEQAKLDLEHAHLFAACDGNIAQLSVRPGDSVRAGTPLFALVCEQDFWVEANFKETQLHRIIPGQPADITVDMYPGRHFNGRVENIGRASGAAFSLLPPQNATGNWVKVTQRVPVRIMVLDPDPGLPLRVGTSAVVTVDTTAPPAQRTAGVR